MVFGWVVCICLKVGIYKGFFWSVFNFCECVLKVVLRINLVSLLEYGVSISSLVFRVICFLKEGVILIKLKLMVFKVSF